MKCTELLTLFILFFIVSKTTNGKLHINNSVLNRNKEMINLEGNNLHSKFNFNSKIQFLEKSNSKKTNDYQGWLKYIELSDDQSQLPPSFQKNSLFVIQMKEKRININQFDYVGKVYIPAEEYFWLELKKNVIQIKNSRNPKYQKTFNILNLSTLITETAINPCKGGVEDMGNFKEGYCFMLKFVKLNKHYIWELCAETAKEKQQWMQIILRIQKNSNKINEMFIPAHDDIIDHDINGFLHHDIIHHDQLIEHRPLNSQSRMINLNSGYIPQGAWNHCTKKCGTGIQQRPLKCTRKIRPCNGPSVETRSCNLQKCSNELKKKLENLKKVSEGKWEYLGDWSACSKPCGNGITTRNRKCPSNTCAGDIFVQKSCNNFECSQDLFNKNSYEECKKAEGNLIMNRNINTHIILTPDHIDLYSDPLLSFPHLTFSLNHIVKLEKKENNCFNIIGDDNKQVELCSQGKLFF